jgi:hypothetical protein
MESAEKKARRENHKMQSILDRASQPSVSRTASGSAWDGMGYLVGAERCILPASAHPDALRCDWGRSRGNGGTQSRKEKGAWMVVDLAKQ